MPLQRANYQAVTEVVFTLSQSLVLHIFSLLCISVFNTSGLDALQRCSVATLLYLFLISAYSYALANSTKRLPNSYAFSRSTGNCLSRTSAL